MWAYEGIPMPVGQIEYVGTLPEYHRRGLVRAQFEVVHAWSAERGHLLETMKRCGIYRQFGYEMAIEFVGGRDGFPRAVPALGEGEAEPYRVRPMTGSDIPFAVRVYDFAMRRYQVSCVWDPALWRYALRTSGQGCNGSDLRIIETTGGIPSGILAHGPESDGPNAYARIFEIDAGVSWPSVTPSVLRYLKATGEARAARKDGAAFTEMGFALGSAHPAYALVRDLMPLDDWRYALYVRNPGPAGSPSPDRARFWRGDSPRRRWRGIRANYG